MILKITFPFKTPATSTATGYEIMQQGGFSPSKIEINLNRCEVSSTKFLFNTSQPSNIQYTFINNPGLSSTLSCGLPIDPTEACKKVFYDLFSVKNSTFSSNDERCTSIIMNKCINIDANTIKDVTWGIVTINNYI